jgi:hypothetical protein
MSISQKKSRLPDAGTLNEPASSRGDKYKMIDLEGVKVFFTISRNVRADEQIRWHYGV